MDISKMVFGGAILGTVVSAWSTIKSAMWRICTIIFKKAIIEEYLYPDLLNYLREEYKYYCLHDRRYGMTEHYLKNGGCYVKTGWESFRNFSILFFKGRIPFLFNKYETTSDNKDGSSTTNSSIMIYYLRGTLCLEDIIKKAIDRKNRITSEYHKSSAESSTRFFIRTFPENNNSGTQLTINYDFTSMIDVPISHKIDELGLLKTENGLENIILTDDNRDIVKLAETWKNNKQWYQSKNIPWKMGWLLHGPPGTGKCFGKDTEVLMYDGKIKKVQDVEVGDLLMGPDSQPRKVTSLANGIDQLYEIVPTKGKSYIVNSEHILSLVMNDNAGFYRKGEIVNINLQDFLKKSNNFKRHAKGWRACVDFDSKELKIPPYLLGVWLGDGSKNETQITNVSNEVIDYLYKIASDLDMELTYNNIISYRLVKRKGIGQTRYGENIFRNFLKEYKLLNNPHIPDIYKCNGINERLELLAGIIDTDGSLNCNGYDIVSKFPVLTNDILYLARSLGFAAYPSYCKKKCYNNGVDGYYCRIFISGNTDIIPVKIKSKRANKRKQIKNVLHTGIKINKKEIGEYYGFTLEGNDRLFLLSDFTVVHNTLLSRRIAEHLKIPIFIFKLGMMGDIQFSEKWQSLQAFTPCIALIEDFDNIFNGRENISNYNPLIERMSLLENGQDNSPNEKSVRTGGKISFDNFINTLDGAERYEGILTIITTNHIDKVDPAILNRPGRIDNVIELTYLTESNKYLMAKQLLSDMPEALVEVIQYLQSNKDSHLTPARLQEVCTSVALKHFYRQNEAQ